MKKFTLILLLIPCFIFISAQELKASHAVGADITYAYAGPNQYMVTVKFYRDCDGISAPTNVIIEFESDTCGLTGSTTIYPISGTGNEIPTGAFNPCYITSCNGGNGYGVQEHIYQGIVTLPAACVDWVLSTEINARNAAITTTTASVTLRAEASLDNLNNAIDTSAVFSTYPVSRFCINRTFNYNQGATDPDPGDSLVFSLVDALQGANQVVPYVTTPPPGYSGTNPITSVPPVFINSNTGVITFTPTTIQVGIFAILVQTYRNGVLIGSVRRDMQVNIEAVCNEPPLLHTATLNGNSIVGDTIVANCGDSVLYVKLATPVHCNSVAFDGSDFRMISPSGLPIPIVREIPINCINGMTDSIQIHLYSLSSRLTENGRYFLWSKIGTDGNTLLNDCGQALIEYDTTTFVFNSCYSGKVDLTNVSVDNGNENMEVFWTPPSDLPGSQFQSYDIYRSEMHNSGTYQKIGAVSSITTHFYLDTAVVVPERPYTYAVAIHLNTGFVCPGSDSIQSIFLTGSKNADSTTMSLLWTPYWGWSNPLYQVVQSDDGGATFSPVPNASSSSRYITYTMPDAPGKYIVRIHTANGALLSRSNWLEFEVYKLEVFPPNVMTPNGDGFNDKFHFENLEYYPNSKLKVFNRWGVRVYESDSYKNDWNGDDLKDGVYYYTLKIANYKSTELNGTLNIFRGK